MSDRVLLSYPTLLSNTDDFSKSSWIQVARTGEFHSNKYGKFAITKDDLAQMARNFANVTPVAPTQLPIDYDHLSMAPKKPGDGAAAGWMDKLELRKDGTQLWAEVSWTPPAAEAVRNKEYRFVSPSFVKDYTWKDGKKIGTTLLAAAITNHPFLEGMAAVTLSDGSWGHVAALDLSFGKASAPKDQNALPQSADSVDPTAVPQAATAQDAAAADAAEDAKNPQPTQPGAETTAEFDPADDQGATPAVEAAIQAAAGPDSSLIDITDQWATYKQNGLTYRRSFAINDGAVTFMTEPEEVTVHVVPVAPKAAAPAAPGVAPAAPAAPVAPGAAGVAAVKAPAAGVVATPPAAPVAPTPAAAPAAPSAPAAPAAAAAPPAVAATPVVGKKKPNPFAKKQPMNMSTSGVHHVLPTNGKGDSNMKTFKLSDVQGTEVEVSEEVIKSLADQLVPEGSVVVPKTKLETLEGAVTNLTNQVGELATSLQNEETKGRTLQLTRSLDTLSQAGRISKVQRDWAMKTFITNLAAFDEWSATLPTESIVPLNKEVGSGDKSAPAGDANNTILDRARVTAEARHISLREAIQEESRKDLNSTSEYLDSFREFPAATRTH